MPKILVIDDDKFFLTIMDDLLKSGGYEIQLAENVADFEKRLAAFKPDIICADIHMPDIRGDRLAFYMREIYQTSKPVILISADDANIAQYAEEAGGNAFVAKKEIHTKLIPIIESLLK